MNLFHNYLRHCLGETVFPCSFINLKKYENSPSPGLKKNLKKIYEELGSSESVYKHPFFIGYHRHFRNYENLGGLLKEFSKKKEATLAYAQACFLALQVADERLYDEYRKLADLFSETMEKLLSEGIDLEKSLLLLPALYYKYMSPEFLKFIPKTDFEHDLYKKWKEKLKERYPL